MARSLNSTVAWILTIIVAAHWAAVVVEAPADLHFERSGLAPGLERAADLHPSNLPRAVRIVTQADWKLSNREPPGKLLGTSRQDDPPSFEGTLLVPVASGGALPLAGDQRRYDPRAPPV